jgi:hypothetical protein
MACGEVVLQQAVDEAVAAPDLTEENTPSGIIEEVHVVPGPGAVIPERQTEHEMLETCLSPVSESGGQSNGEPPARFL